MSLFDPNPLNSFLKKLNRHSALAQDEQNAIRGLPGHPAQVGCNGDFVKLGEEVDYACLIVDGLVGRFGQNRDGDRQITALHVPGDMADLHSVASPKATSALQALTVTTIFKVPHEALRHVARRYPNIAEAFWRECVADAAVLAEWVVNVGRRDARSRTAHFLCEVACRLDASGGRIGFGYDLPITQNHLGDILALTPVHVNRTLKALREQNIAHFRDKQVTVLDWEAMVEVGDFDATYLQVRGEPASIPVAAAG